ncbi:MAG: general secretion pathway protein GspB [Candidatus Thiodiazotropha sp. (ex Monitilora ramsayi)]|nr:general secretion pathway protein GspB [Candidatus Thiodiazotropha sp. (ex Monitilora ramsayi)]
MSLILEALKKAERQHQLGEVPGIRPGPAEAQSRSLRGLGWIMFLLVAGIMLGIGIYLGGYRQSLVDQDEAAALPSAVNTRTTAPSDIAVPTNQGNGGADPAQPTQALPEQVEPVQPAVQLSQKPKTRPKPAKPLSEMPSGFIANLPGLNIDIHSYDERPAKRYVLINLEKYREGDYLAEGPLLIEILTDGVVLEHLGERFILPIGNQ